MKNRKILFIFLSLWVSFFNNLEAQTKKDIEKDIDNFKQNLNIDLDSSFYYIKRAYKNSLAIDNDTLIARSSFNLGYCYNIIDDNKNSTKYVSDAIIYAKKVKLYRILSLSYDLLGKIDAKNDKNDLALKNYLKSYDISVKNNLFECESIVLINLGNLYLKQEDTIKSLDCYNKNIINAEKNGLKKELLSGYLNSAVIHSKKNLKLSEKYYNKAIVIANEIGDLYSEYNLHINMSELYGSKEAEKSLKHLQAAQLIQKELDDESLLFYLNFNFGSYYKKQDKLNEAFGYYNQALLHAKNHDVSKAQMLSIYKVLSEIYKYRNDYKNAYIYNEKYNHLSEVLFTLEKDKTFEEIQTKYDVEKKNLTIKVLNNQRIIERNRNLYFLYVGIVLILGLIGVILFFKYRINQQRNLQAIQKKVFLQEKENLNQEQELKRIKAIVEGQDKERNRLAQEIHDGVGAGLAGLKLNLSQVNSEIKSDKINLILDKMTVVFQELRSISHNLSINRIKDKGLELLLIELKNEYESRKEFSVEVALYSDNDFKTISDDIKLQLYRIVQELLNNTSKYANAQNVIIDITHFENTINLLVEDDGIGFDNKKSDGIGLKNIKDRVSTIGGDLSIDSKIGRGSSFIIEIKDGR